MAILDSVFYKLAHHIKRFSSHKYKQKVIVNEYMCTMQPAVLNAKLFVKDTDRKLQNVFQIHQKSWIFCI
jgi:hypothetical protein